MRNYTYLLTIAGLCYSYIITGQCNPYNQDNVWEESWLSCVEQPNFIHPNSDSHWILYDFDEIYTIDSLHIWNYNLDSIRYGIKDFSIYSSLDSISWVHKGDYSIPIATGSMSYLGSGFEVFLPYRSRYLLIDVVDNYGGDCAGLSEIKIGIESNPCSDFAPQVSVTYLICQDSFELAGLIDNEAGNLAYHWSTGATDSMIIVQTEGSYQVTISDDNCTEIISINVQKPNQGFLGWESGERIPSGTYYSTDSIITSGIVESTEDVTFLLKDNLGLVEDFIVDYNSSYTAQIVNCPTDTDASILQAIISDPLPRLVYQDFIGCGNSFGIKAFSSDANSDRESLTGLGGLMQTESYRFLAQASFGADVNMIEELNEIGIEEWIDWQTSIPHTSYFNHLYYVKKFGNEILYWTNYHRSWWQNILSGEDFLRDRMAYALSQILVISSKSFLLNFGEGMTSYYDLMSKHAFGNYRDLLYDVTLHPMMGFYLSHMNNPKSDLSQNIFPDENFAREVLQLFSIGLYELNIDGTRKKDLQNEDIPTYDNNDIIEFAKIFTGLGGDGRAFGQEVRTVVNFNLESFMIYPMIMHEEHHEPGEKLLLNNQTIPSGQTGLQDINDAIDNIFNHPNVGPFLATRLIQRFVKSAPSPAYVQRVAEVFNDNGEGVRGDLGAVIKAVLVDDEARNCLWLDVPEHGKLKEPLLRFTQVYKAFDLSGTQGTFYAEGLNIEQTTAQAPLRAPSVFNFYQPNYSPPGILGDQFIPAPEFQIFNSSTSIGYVNMIDTIIVLDQPLLLDQGSAQLNFDEEISISDHPTTLVDHLNIKLTNGTLKSRTKTIIIEALNQLPGSDPMEKVRLAIYLITSSPEFNILK